jgi:23S rRNA (pseudouridine1915-N3)-methyltransferase
VKVLLLQIGKTDESYLQEGCSIYESRLKHYVAFETETILIPKKIFLTEEQKILEGQLLLKKITNQDFVVLLDENGKEFNSINFSNWIQKNMNSGIKRLVFVIGGPFGFSEDVYSRANQQIALSQMTFSHQMVRLFFLEQLYRGFTILKGEKYHHS